MTLGLPYLPTGTAVLKTGPRVLGPRVLGLCFGVRASGYASTMCRAAAQVVPRRAVEGNQLGPPVTFRLLGRTPHPRPDG